MPPADAHLSHAGSAGTARQPRAGEGGSGQRHEHSTQLSRAGQSVAGSMCAPTVACRAEAIGRWPGRWKGKDPIRSSWPAGNVSDVFQHIAASPGLEAASPAAQVPGSGQARGFCVVAGGIRGHEIINAVIGMPGPGQDVIGLPASLHRHTAVEVLTILGVAEQPAYTLEADPPGTVRYSPPPR
jgi:hypothetical protein